MKIKYCFFIILLTIFLTSCFLVDTASIEGEGGTIPDEGGRDFTAEQTGAGLAYSMESVTVTGLTHTWAADLIIKLTAPDGSNCELVNADGEKNDFNGDYTFVPYDADAPALFEYDGREVYENGVIIPQELRSKGYLQNILPSNIAGQWILTVSDARAGDTGSFESFSIKISYFKPWW